MIRIVHCSVCGKQLQGIERNCSYCGKPLCRKHCINGLCPDHQHTMTAKQSRQIDRQSNSLLWVVICACSIGGFAFFFGIVGLIWGEDKTFGIVSMAIFVVVVIGTILIHRRNSRRTDEIHTEIKRDQQQLVSICPNCGGPIMARNSSCSNCGMTANRSSHQPVPPSPNTNNVHERHIPPPPPGWTPNQNIDRGLQEILDANPGSKIEVTGFYDEATNSGFHICKHCNMRFETKGDTRECPYCRKPIYG